MIEWTHKLQAVHGGVGVRVLKESQEKVISVTQGQNNMGVLGCGQ